MPSLAELCEVYKNRAAINESLEKIHDLNNSYADSSLGGYSRYWSSSQYSYNSNQAWQVSFHNGLMSVIDKDCKSYYNQVCCLAGF